MPKVKITVTRKPKRLNNGPPLPRPVTIIVLTWNAVAETMTLIDSIREQPLPENVDLLFVDNGSRDYTVDLLMKLGLRVVINPTNLGYTRGVNRGISETTNDVVLLNNDAALVHKDWLELMQQTAYIEGVGVVGCRLIGHNGEVLHAGGQIDHETWEGTNIHCKLDERREVLDVEFVTFGCVYIKRETIAKVGVLDEGYFAYYEDSDYCYRVREAGMRVVMDGRVNLMHRESASSRHNGMDLKPIIDASRQHFISKWVKRTQAQDRSRQCDDHCSSSY